MTGTKDTVLVVEDDASLCDLYETWLAGYDVRTTGTVAAAVDALDGDVDVAVLDRRLPDGTGSDVAAVIQERGLGARVAMVTGVEPDVALVERGFDAYLTKPVDRDAVVETVDRLLRVRTYDEDVQEFYRLAATKAALEAAHSPEELEDSAEYRELCSRLDAVRSRATATAGAVTDPVTVSALFRDGDSA